MARVVIISILPAENIPDTELELELRQRLESKSFSIDHIAVVSDTEIEVANKRKLTN